MSQTSWSRGRRILVSCTAGAILALVGAFFLWKPWTEDRPRNLVLISIDTCRADHLSCYGFGRATTPHLDALAAHGVLFENVVSPAPMTLPAHSSLFTGMLPRHGVHDNFYYRLAPSNMTLAQWLKERGFATGAVVSADVLYSRFGLSRGFDTYDDQFREKTTSAEVRRKGGEATERATEWLDRHRKERFFLFVHYYDAHVEYDPPEPFASRFAPDRYAGSIAYVDACIGKLLERLQTLGLDRSTMVVIVGDHGEMLGEHGEEAHSYFIYEAALKVPLIVSVPGRRNAVRVKDIVSLIDVAPTVCALLGVEKFPEAQGEDLSPLFRAARRSESSRYVYSESLTPTKYGAAPLLGVETGRWKYIHTARPELYDLARDPDETRNLVDKESTRAASMRAQLAAILRRQVTSNAAGKVQVDATTLRQLQTLGYVGGQVKEDLSLSDMNAKEDPKDLIGFHGDNSKATASMLRKDFSAAKPLFERMVAQRPAFWEGHTHLAEIAMDQQHDYPAAIAHLEKAIAQEPNLGMALQGLGQALAAMGRDEEAIEKFQRIIRTVPDYPNMAQTYLRLGQSQWTLGRYREAAEAFRQALARDPANAEIHNAFGMALALLGKADDAIAEYRKALALDPTLVMAHINLVSAFGAQRNAEEMEEHYRQAIALDPDKAATRYSLGDAFEGQQRFDRALECYAKAVQLDPGHAMAHFRIGEHLARAGRMPQALREFEEAARLAPNLPAALNQLAWMLATDPMTDTRAARRAVALAERACELTKNTDAALLDTLAAAYAAAGQFDKAVETARRAIALCNAAAMVDAARGFKDRLALYEQRKPYRELTGPPPESAPDRPRPHEDNSYPPR